MSNTEWVSRNGVEYSRNHNFFLKEQVVIRFTNNREHIKIFSRLNGELFYELNDNKEFTEDKVNNLLFNIHKNIIS